VLEEPTTDRRSARRAATQREILDAAWEMVRAEGLAGLSLRDLARRIGLQAPSLYAYFPSKAAIYDAMVREGYEAFLARREAAHADGATDLTTIAMTFAEFCVEDHARYQLMFQRTIPGFEPSPASFEPAVRALDLAREVLAANGVTSAEAVDVYTALMTGLVDQQISNDPGGDRWIRLIPAAVAMFTNHFGGSR
jgi:AcrR family transcriptional regulator